MKKKPVRKWKRIVRRLILLILILLIAACGCAYGYQQLKSEYTITYDAYTASTGSISNSLSFSGSFQLVNSLSLTAPEACKVRTLYVAAGDAVQKGDRLVRLSNGDTYTADFDGRINTLSASEGDELSAGAPIMQVVDFTHMKVTLRVDEYDISSVSVGTRCTITATATERTYESAIAAIDYVSASSGSVAYYTATTYVDVDEGVYPGMQATVSIPEEEADNVVILKVDALSFDAANQAFVYMQDEAGEMQQVLVEVGVSNGNYCEIVSGLSDGDTVYVESTAEETSGGGIAGLLSSLFNQGAPTVNGRNNGSGGRGGNMSGFGGAMPSGEGGFAPGSMPDMGSGRGGMGGGN